MYSCIHFFVTWIRYNYPYFLLLTVFGYGLISIGPDNPIFGANVYAIQDNSTTSNFIQYDGSKYGFVLDYPQNWRVKDALGTGVWFISPVDESGNIRIDVTSAYNLTLPEAARTRLLQSSYSYKQMDMITSNITSLAGVPASRTDYKFKIEFPINFLSSDIIDYRGMQISAIKGENVYTVTYFSTPENFDVFLPIVNRMLSTLKIL